MISQHLDVGGRTLSSHVCIIPLKTPNISPNISVGMTSGVRYINIIMLTFSPAYDAVYLGPTADMVSS